MNFLKVVLSGSFWMTLNRIILRGGSLVLTVILARYFTPNEYGVLMTILLLIYLLQIASFGLNAAVVQKKKNVNLVHFDVSWTYDALFTRALVCITLLIFSENIASVFDILEYERYVKMIAFIPFIQVFENSAMTKLTRDLDFKRRFYLELPISIVNVLAIPVIIFTKNPDYFVWIFIVGTLGRSIMSYVLYPVIPKVNFNLVVFKELFSYGKWLVLQNLLMKFKDRITQIILGILLGPLALGGFQLVSRFSTQLFSEFYETLNKVLFPIYAKIQDDMDSLRKSYVRIFMYLVFFIAPFALLLNNIGESILTLFFEFKYSEYYTLIPYLIIYGLCKCINESTIPLYRGVGYVKYEFIISSVELLITIGLIYPFVNQWGILGVAYSMNIAILLTVLLNLFLFIRLVFTDIYEFFMKTYKSFLFGILPLLSFYVMNSIDLENNVIFIVCNIFVLIITLLINLLMFSSLLGLELRINKILRFSKVD